MTADSRAIETDPVQNDFDGFATSDQLIATIDRQVAADAIALAVWDADHPRPDELLAVRGIDQATLAQWCQRGAGDDDLFHQATARGMATRNDNPHPLTDQPHALAVGRPESLGEQRWWYLLLSRSNKPFNDAEAKRAQLLLDELHMSLTCRTPDDVGRLIVGHDDRLIVANLQCRRLMIDRPGLVTQLMQTLRPVVHQRFATTQNNNGRMHDFAVELSGRPTWVCFRHTHSVDLPGADHWHVELRPLEADDLPLVGTLEDDRIARAIAFLHENYQQSPTLAHIARSVHMSPFHFHRLFSKQLGVSPKHYLQRIQLQVARWLLRQRKLPIGEIAVRTGFASHGHFTSTFHRIVGISPSEYREQL